MSFQVKLSLGLAVRLRKQSGLMGMTIDEFCERLLQDAVAAIETKSRPAAVWPPQTEKRSNTK